MNFIEIEELNIFRKFHLRYLLGEIDKSLFVLEKLGQRKQPSEDYINLNQYHLRADVLVNMLKVYAKYLDHRKFKRFQQIKQSQKPEEYKNKGLKGNLELAILTDEFNDFLNELESQYKPFSTGVLTDSTAIDLELSRYWRD